MYRGRSVIYTVYKIVTRSPNASWHLLSNDETWKWNLMSHNCEEEVILWLKVYPWFWKGSWVYHWSPLAPQRKETKECMEHCTSDVNTCNRQVLSSSLAVMRCRSPSRPPTPRLKASQTLDLLSSHVNTCVSLILLILNGGYLSHFPVK